MINLDILKYIQVYLLDQLTAKNFYGNDWFSNIIIFSEETMWYGQVYSNLYPYKKKFYYKVM